jgi:hypothetical protein
MHTPHTHALHAKPTTKNELKNVIVSPKRQPFKPWEAGALFCGIGRESGVATAVNEMVAPTAPQ